MKKIFALALVAAMLACTMLTLASCGSQQYKVGTQSGTTGFDFMNGNPDFGYTGFSNLGVSAYDNGGLAVKDMLNGNIDFVVIDNAPAAQLVAANTGVKMIDIALTTEEYGIAVNKNDSALLASINNILATKQTEINAIFTKYSSVESETDYTGTTIPAGTYDAGKNQLVVATNAAFAPYEFKVGESFAGIDMEIAKLIADELGMELVISDMEFDSIVSSIGQNGVDIGIAGMTINPARQKVVNFSNPYFSGAYQVVICKEDCTLFDACKTTDDILAVLNGLDKK